MKSFLKAIFLFTVAILLAYGNAWALPFSSTGIVYPSHGDSWDPESLTGIARFDLIIDDPDVYINYVTLEFENDIFDFTGWGASDITVVNPGDWTTSVISNASGYRFSVSQAGTPATSQVVIDIAYTLLDAAMYSSATGDGWAWDEG
ncbi:MAG: hypothetical protein JXI32_05310, partial [Deltaproteobacteria bacterium]|nr:hypothetical protein [Deltaproteobacteria bacterium]